MGRSESPDGVSSERRTLAALDRPVFWTSMLHLIGSCILTQGMQNPYVEAHYSDFDNPMIGSPIPSCLKPG